MCFSNVLALFCKAEWRLIGKNYSRDDSPLGVRGLYLLHGVKQNMGGIYHHCGSGGEF